MNARVLGCAIGLALMMGIHQAHADSDGTATFIVNPVDESAALKLRTQALWPAGDAAPGVRFARTLATGHLLFEATQPGNDVLPTLARSLQEHPWVADVQRNRVMTASFQGSVAGDLPKAEPPPDELLWNHADKPGGAKVVSAWPLSRGKGVVVAVVDSGITDHPDFAGRVLPGYDFITDPSRARDGDGRDDDATDEGQLRCSSQGFWHGTRVAGVIAASGKHGENPIGVAPESLILPVRVLDANGGGTAVDIGEAIIWAAGGHVDGIPDNPTPAQVINLSLTASWPCDSFSAAAIKIATGLGATVTATAGDTFGSGNDASMITPASCPGVLAVAATLQSGKRTRFSNFGPVVRLAAPGGDVFPGDVGAIWTTTNTGCTGPEDPAHGWFEGTDAAAPHVAGTAALVRAANPGLGPRDVRHLIIETTSQLDPGACPEGCGSGLLDAASAVGSAIDLKEGTK
jgi:serine protease